MQKKCGRACRIRVRRKKRVALLPSNEDERYFNLLKWMGKQGYKPVKKLKPQIFQDTGRGLMAKEAIFPGSLIISVPNNLLISAQTVLKTYLGCFINKYCSTVTAAEIISVFLMCEKLKDKSSHWYPYITTLPETYTTPIYHHQSILAKLPSSIYLSTIQQNYSVRNSYAKLQTLLSSLEHSFPEFLGVFTFDLYLWAWFSVNTRCIYIDCDDINCKGKLCNFHLALAPFLDLLNHAADVQVRAACNNERNCYELTSLSHFKKFSQVFISYGNHDNRKLFLEYGFVLDNNLNDVIPVSIDEVATVFSNLCQLDSMLEKLGFVKNQKYLFSNMGCCREGLTWNLETVLKILTLPNPIRYSLEEVLDGKAEINELQYRKLAKEIILTKLQEYLHVLETDDCKCTKLKNPEQFCLILHMCMLEKDILLKALSEIDKI